MILKNILYLFIFHKRKQSRMSSSADMCYEVERVYEYKYGDKKVTVKRKWNNNGITANKRKALNDYIEQNKDEITKMKNYKAVFNDYISKNQDHKVSYTTMVNKLHDVFGKKNIKQSRYELKNTSNSSESDKEDNELLN